MNIKGHFIFFFAWAFSSFITLLVGLSYSIPNAVLARRELMVATWVAGSWGVGQLLTWLKPEDPFLVRRRHSNTVDALFGMLLLGCIITAWVAGLYQAWLAAHVA